MVVARRDAEGGIPDEYRAGLDLSKLETVTVPDLLTWLRSGPAPVDAFRGGSALFCALGTTRADAGTAQAWRDIDVHCVQEAARAAKEACVSHFSLVTSVGANAKLW